MMGLRAKSRHVSRGFTIVELLIVVVVVGILAAISIIAYSGVQQRASNAQTISAVVSYKTALIAYALDNRSYPVTGSVCLGAGYPDLNADSVGDCGTSAGSVTYSKNATMDTALNKYGGSGGPSVNQYSVGTWVQFGVTFEYIPTFILDGVAQPWWLSYELGGASTTCASAGGISMAGGGSNLSSTPPNGWSGASENWPTAIKCWLPLPDPSK